MSSSNKGGGGVATAPRVEGPRVGDPMAAVVFEYTGAPQSYTVPDGVVAVTFRVWGADGGTGKQWCNNPCPETAAGLGGYAEGRIAVTGGQTLEVVVGGRGGPGSSSTPGGPGGWPGGGKGGNGIFDTHWGAGGGGGASRLRRDGADLVVAAGGGGGGSGGTSEPLNLGGQGGAGGAPGVDGHEAYHTPYSGWGGKGGTASAGGAGGAAGSTGSPGQAGARDAGGAGADGADWPGGYRGAAGGGGGEGYYGGGGGGGGGTEAAFLGGGGGGGGASWADPSVDDARFETGVRSGAGRIEIIPTLVAPVVDTVSEWRNGGPAIPEGLKLTVLRSPDSTDEGSAYPVLRWLGLTYWPLSFYDNRVAMAIVAYDETGAQVGRWDRDGTRYIYEILVDADTRTVRFIGQSAPSGNTITMGWDEMRP